MSTEDYEITASDLEEDGTFYLLAWSEADAALYGVSVDYAASTASVVQWWLGNEEYQANLAALGEDERLRVTSWAAHSSDVRASYERERSRAKYERQLSDAWGE